MLNYDDIFYANFHMNPTTFNDLYVKVEKHLVAVRDNRPDAIPPRHRLAMTLE